MGISIKDQIAEKRIRELAEREGETLTEAVLRAVELRLQHPSRSAPKGSLEEQLGRLDILYEMHDLKSWSDSQLAQDDIYNWAGLPI